MDDCVHTTIIMTPNQFKEYVPVPADFDTVFPEARIQEIAAAFREGFAAIARSSKPKDGQEEMDAAGMLKPLERDVTKLWVEVTKQFYLFPGYFFHSSETTPDVGDKTRLRIDASLISNDDKKDVVDKRSHWPLIRLGIELKPGGTEYDAFEKREYRPAETATISRRKVRGQLMSYSKHTFACQHRTKLFQMLINGQEYRAMRWDRSGVIVTDNVNYVDDIAGTRLLLELLFGFSQLSDTAQGLDDTAVRVKPGSCAWMRMEVLAFYQGDVDQKERSRVTRDDFPANFAFPEETLNAPVSPLFENSLLHHNPCADCNPSTDHHSTTFRPDPLPVWKYMRALFRDSLDNNSPRYQLTVGGQKYLVGKPIFEASGMVSRATRGYIALEWSTQRFVFLKDAWRPFYVGIDREGDVLSELNKAKVPYVPTLIVHEDVCEADGNKQETETSRYAPHASKELRKKVDRRGAAKASRTIAPLPARRARKPTTSCTQPSAGPSSINDVRPIPASALQLGAGSASTSNEAPNPTSRGVKRTANETEKEEEGSGLRHLTHYRLVVAEVCLPSTAFTSGRQWVRVVLHSIYAHKGAYELCGIIHRDVSVGNILIYPKYIPGSNGRKGMVFWVGMLCDWELAKKITVEDARQPERTGTWQFMSLRCLEDPTLAVLLPDELESFTHALLYNGIRFLCHNLPHIEGFVSNYFDESPLDGHNRNTAPHGKSTSIYAGTIKFGSVPIVFRAPKRRGVAYVVHPLNIVFKSLMGMFRARYVILDWNADQEKAKTADAPVDFDDVGSDEEDEEDEEDMERLAATLTGPAFPSPFHSTSVPHPTAVVSAADSDVAMKEEVLQDEHPTDMLDNPADSAGAVPVPTGQDYALAKLLDTHQAVIDLFEKQLNVKSAWPSARKDMVGYDRLYGYRAPARAVPCSGKPPKQICTVPVGRVDAPQFGQASGRKQGDEGKGHGHGEAVTITGRVPAH
ncbi:hypothetical protein C8Q80DRAFT_1357571 [Daedaleopsis nitida]|nr:hypothetical protein C8Q80DRAFT_1357571 [Daedaleopsis nitida]